LMIMPFSMLLESKTPKIAPPYMGGRTTEGGMKFSGSLGMSRDLVLSNYYLRTYFGEEKLFMVGVLACWGIILIALVMVVGVVL
ncbi:MAG TPA: NADH-quinone oxidoreductase subunit L, partial [Methanoregula sp.]|nr:NADH-quinone oxidoreductase subunit L [Methanoregula sp.]